MSDIKSVIALLCKHLNLSMNLPFKPEYFRLSKYNETNESVGEVLWAALHILVYHAVKNKQQCISFFKYDPPVAIKLCLAHLNYQMIEFYGLTPQDNCNRQLLLAFAWLIGTKNALNVLVRSRLMISYLGREFSFSHISNKTVSEIDPSLPCNVLMDNILRLSSKINFNLKAIDGLLTEKAALTAKTHAASLDMCGLPHLSVAEVALSKRVATIKKNTDSDKDRLEEIHSKACMLDIHTKWLKKEHLFYDWMVTVLEKHRNDYETDVDHINLCQILKFMSVLHHEMEEKLNLLHSTEALLLPERKYFECTSRSLRIQNTTTEIEKWLTEMSVLEKENEEVLKKRKEEVAEKLKLMLKRIPSCIQV